MILEVAQIILAAVFFLFLPGWLLVKAFFDDNKVMEKILIAVVLSIIIALLIGLFFGYDRTQADLTGGFTEKNIWVGEIAATALAGLIFIIKRRFNKKEKLLSEKTLKRKEEKMKKKEIANSKKQAKLEKKTVKPKKDKKSFSDKFSEFKSNKGLYQLVTRSAIFFGIVLLFYLGIFLWFRFTPFFIQYLQISTDFYLPFMQGLRKTDFLNAGVFALVAFIIWNRDYLKNLKPTKRNVGSTVMFLLLAALSIFGHYFFKYWITLNPVIANDYLLLFTIIKQALIVLFIVFLAFAIYTQKMIFGVIKDKWKSILIFVGIGITYFFLIQFFQLIWYQLSYFVTVVLRAMLSLTFGDVYFSAGTPTQGPRLGVDGFNVGISNECSGVDSLLLFLSLYTLLLVLDWKRLNVKRMFILLIPGLIGTVAYNILRIYLLMLVGIFISPTFAVSVFHTNIGWMLFLLFFVIFWHYGSKWVYKKKS